MITRKKPLSQLFAICISEQFQYLRETQHYFSSTILALQVQASGSADSVANAPEQDIEAPEIEGVKNVLLHCRNEDLCHLRLMTEVKHFQSDQYYMLLQINTETA